MGGKGNICVRFDLRKSDEKKAWDYLKNLDREKFHSYADLVSKALNFFFEGTGEVDLLVQLQATIREEIGKIQVVQVSSTQLDSVEKEPDTLSESDLDAAMSFIDSF